MAKEQFKLNYINFNASYRERNKRTEKITNDIDEFVEMLTHKNKIYEILYDKPIKLFIDVDGVESDKPDLINNLIKDLIEFLNNEFKTNLNNDDYALTMNTNSKSHKGLSYHIYFPKLYVSNISYINYILKLFIKQHNIYYEYIDGVIYHYNRLFRCVNQYNAGNEAKIEFIEESNDETLKNDIHILKHGEIIDTIIQYIPDYAEKIKLNMDVKKVKGVNLKNSSFDVRIPKMKKQIRNLKIQNKAFNSVNVENVNIKDKDEFKEMYEEYKNEFNLINIDENILNNLNDIQMENILIRCEIIRKIKDNIIDIIEKVNDENKEK